MEETRWGSLSARAERGGEAGFSEKKEQGWGREGVGKVNTLTAVLRREAYMENLRGRGSPTQRPSDLFSWALVLCPSFEHACGVQDIMSRLSFA